MIYYDSARDPWNEVVARCGFRYELITVLNGQTKANIYKGDKLVGELVDLVRGFEWLRVKGYAQPRKVARKGK